MVALQLDRLWINLLSTGDAVSARTAPGRKRTAEVDGEVRVYAGGRLRAITRLGDRGTFAFTLRLVSLATIETLEDWQGRAVQVRDHRGQRWFGVFHAVLPTEHKPADLYDVAIELHTITYAEDV